MRFTLCHASKTSKIFRREKFHIKSIFEGTVYQQVLSTLNPYQIQSEQPFAYKNFSSSNLHNIKKNLLVHVTYSMFCFGND